MKSLSLALLIVLAGCSDLYPRHPHQEVSLDAGPADAGSADAGPAPDSDEAAAATRISVLRPDELDVPGGHCELYLRSAILASEAIVKAGLRPGPTQAEQARIYNAMRRGLQQECGSPYQLPELDLGSTKHFQERPPAALVFPAAQCKALRARADSLAKEREALSGGTDSESHQARTHMDELQTRERWLAIPIEHCKS